MFAYVNTANKRSFPFLHKLADNITHICEHVRYDACASREDTSPSLYSENRDYRSVCEVLPLHLCSAVVLLDKRGHDSSCYGVARSVGGAAGSLEQLGAGPHKLQVWLTQVMFAVCKDIICSRESKNNLVC